MAVTKSVCLRQVNQTAKRRSGARAFCAKLLLVVVGAANCMDYAQLAPSTHAQGLFFLSFYCF